MSASCTRCHRILRRERLARQISVAQVRQPGQTPRPVPTQFNLCPPTRSLPTRVFTFFGTRQSLISFARAATSGAICASCRTLNLSKKSGLSTNHLRSSRSLTPDPHRPRPRRLRSQVNRQLRRSTRRHLHPSRTSTASTSPTGAQDIRPTRTVT